MKRLISSNKKNITANYAYDFVEKRVELLLDENKDMPEGEAYGIAWKQWKKDHPSWKSKKEREKIKRLKKNK